MKLENINAVEILQSGVMGLGFLLALLSFFLLRAQSAKTKPNNNILKQIRWFMLFSSLLCVIGVLPKLTSAKPVDECKHLVDDLDQTRIEMGEHINNYRDSSIFFRNAYENAGDGEPVGGEQKLLGTNKLKESDDKNAVMQSKLASQISALRGCFASKNGTK